MALWELTARERIRDTLARYTWSGDAGRLDDLARAFTPEGRYRDELVPVGTEWLIARRFVSTDWWAPDSIMVG